jgi:hypothetical protein
LKIFILSAPLDVIAESQINHFVLVKAHLTWQPVDSRDKTTAFNLQLMRLPQRKRERKECFVSRNDVTEKIA